MNDDPEVKLLNESQISQSDNFINFKLIIIGDAGVGKSSILKRAVKNIFEESYQATIGFEFLLMHFQVNDLKIKFQIWDTCGQEMYRSLVQGFYHNTSLALLVYDINKKPTFESLDIWLKDLKQHTEQDLPVFIVGNKNDLDRNVTDEEAKEFKKVNNIVYFAECSAKRGYNVKEIFFEAAKYLYQIYKKFKVQDKVPMAKRLKLDKNENDESNKNKKKKKCC
jgi:small GTP-binding protein